MGGRGGGEGGWWFNAVIFFSLAKINRIFIYMVSEPNYFFLQYSEPFFFFFFFWKFGWPALTDFVWSYGSLKGLRCVLYGSLKTQIIFMQPVGLCSDSANAQTVQSLRLAHMLNKETKGIAVLLLINMCINYGIFFFMCFKHKSYEYNTLIWCVISWFYWS